MYSIRNRLRHAQKNLFLLFAHQRNRESLLVAHRQDPVANRKNVFMIFCICQFDILKGILSHIITTRIRGGTRVRTQNVTTHNTEFGRVMDEPFFRFSQFIQWNQLLTFTYAFVSSRPPVLPFSVLRRAFFPPVPPDCYVSLSLLIMKVVVVWWPPPSTMTNIRS